MKAFVQTSPFERAALWLLPSTRDRALDWLAAAIDSDDGLDADDEFVRAIASQIGPNSALLFYHALRRRCLCPVAIWRPSFVAAFAAGEEVLPKAEPEPEFETLLEAIVDGDDASVDSFLLEFASGGLSREQLEFCEVTPLELARELGRDRIVGELQAFLDGGDPHGALDESLLKRRARQGDPCAQFELGWRRWDTDGAARSDATALRWFRKAAEQWLPEAIRMLGYSFDMGRGVLRSPTRALEAYTKSALLGDFRAALGVALAYDKGDGVSRDAREAAYWYEVAAENGMEQAMYGLACLYARGDGVENKNETAIELLVRAAQARSLPAQLDLSIRYLEGDGVEADGIQSLHWTKLAAETEHPQAIHNLGVAFEEGHGGPADPVRAAD